MTCLVIGHNINAKSVVSCDWASVDPNLNVSEYDLVIVDWGQIKHEIDSGLIDHFEIPDQVGFYDLLEANKILIFIGDSEFITETAKRGMHGIGRKTRTIGNFIPAHPEPQRQVSRSFSVHAHRYDKYFELADEFEFTYNLNRWNGNWDDYIRHMSNIDFDSITYRYEQIASNGGGKSIGVEYSLDLVVTSRNSFVRQFQQPDRVVKSLGSVVWLPPLPTKRKLDGIAALLEQFGHAVCLTEPDWIKNIETYQEQDLKNQVVIINAEIDRLQNSRAEIEERVIAESKWKKLLYLNGDDLESIVQDAFEFIGFEFVKPDKKGIDDGVLSVPGSGDYVVEIKGRKNQIRLPDVRQVVQWKQDKGLPGLMVVNANSDIDPLSRGSSLASNAETHAVSNHIKVLTTSVLFRMVVLTQSGVDVLPAFLESLSGQETYISMSAHSQS